MFKEGIRHPANGVTPEGIDFMTKIIDMSGLGDQTYMGKGASPCPSPNGGMPDWHARKSQSQGTQSMPWSQHFSSGTELLTDCSIKLQPASRSRVLKPS